LVDKGEGPIIASGIITASMVLIVYDVLKTYQPVIAPTQEQKLKYAEVKSKREEIETKDALCECLLVKKKLKDTDCTDIINKFIMRFSQEEYITIQNRANKLV
jgi:hypothetical protein